MSVSRIHHTWLKEILQLRPDERVTKVCNFAWLLAGISECSCTGQVILPGITRRFHQLLENRSRADKFGCSWMGVSSAPDFSELH